MSDLTIRLDGWEELSKKLGKIHGAALDGSVNKALRAGGEVFRSGLTRRIAAHGLVDTGAMGNSPMAAPPKDREVVVSVDAEYAIYHEFGTGIYAEGGGRTTPWRYFNRKLGHVVWTKGVKPKPFVRPTFDEDSKDASDAVGASLWKSVKNIVL